MRRYYKSLLSLFMSVLLLFSVCIPALASYTPQMPEINVYTLVPDGGVSESGYQAQKIVDENGEEVVIESTSSTKKPVSNKLSLIPDKYSSKDLGYCSDVRTQGGTNSCWAFSAVASAESNILRKSLAKNGDDVTDLSEAHLVWFAHKSLTTDIDDPTFGDGTNVSGPYSAGGDWHRSTYTLARGAGFALEKDYPFYPYNSSYMGDYDESKRYDSKVTLNEAFLLPNENTDEIKTAVMEYGSVSVAGLIVTEYLNGAAYFQNKYVGTNHQMIIVGWDDDYSVDNFRAECKPTAPGAWLVKNSYDTTWGENGYFWISYEEPSLNDFFVHDVSLTNEDETIYQYDGYGYNSMLSVQGYYDGAVANVFTAEKNEAIDSVAFYTAQENVTYEISVYRNVTKGADNPVEGGNKSSVITEGVAQHTGYHKIKLDGTVPVSKGETFSIIVRMSVPESEENRIIIPVEGRDETHDGYYSRYYSSEPGQSFFTLSDLAWSAPILTNQDGSTTNLNNVCVKAFTVPDNSLEIRTADEFNAFAEEVANGNSYDGKNVNLMNDIDFAGGEIIPVGTENNPFKGFFKGNGYVLRNGVIDSDSDYVGVFSVLPDNAEIRKLGVENISVSGVYGTGALCGYNEGTIHDCYSTGTVSGEESVGGLVGINAGKVSHSYSICDVTGEYGAGSFIGENDNGEVINSYVITSTLDPIYNDYSDGITSLDGKYFSNGLAAFYLDEGKSASRANAWTKRDGVTTLLKSDDEIIYQVELYDKANISSLYLYVKSSENLKELAEAERPGETVTIYADPQHKVLYTSSPQANMILYVEWATDHICKDSLQFVQGVDATCYTDGNNPYYECSCGKLYTDENTENLVTEVDILILAFRHPLESLIKTEQVEPTHTEDGNIEYYTCTLCGDSFLEEACVNEVESVVIPALGHDHGDWITETEPKCETDGLKVRICSCGDRIEQTVPATGHSYGNWVTEFVPDCENEGLKVKICSSCGDKVEEKIPAAGHSYEASYTEPTETTQGYTTYTCSVCGNAYIDDYIDPVTQVSFTCIVTSYLSESDEVLVELIKRGEEEPEYSMSLAGNSSEFTFEEILSGAYTVRLSKNNHVTREYTIIIEREMDAPEFKIHPVGDINGDGKVNSVDAAMGNAQARGVSTLEYYSFLCADVNGDGKVNSVDAARINAHARQISSLWK